MRPYGLALQRGRLVVLQVADGRIDAIYRGGGATYRLGYDGSRWWCDCPALSRCAHRVALELVVDVTGCRRRILE